MLFGIDSSGKIGEGNLYVGVVEYKSSNFTTLLRNKVRKRHKALASRRRIKASSLTKKELEWVKKSFDSNYSGIVLTRSTFSELKEKLSNMSDWKFKVLAAVIYISCKDMVKSGDVILIDRDYSENVMKRLFLYVKRFFEIEKKKVVIESGTSFNEVIENADLIAGCIRRKIIKTREVRTKKIIKLVKIL